MNFWEGTDTKKGTDEGRKKGEPRNGKRDSKVGKSCDWFSLGVPASSPVLNYHSLKQDNKLTSCSAHTVQPVSVVRRTGTGMGAPFPDSR